MTSGRSTRATLARNTLASWLSYATAVVIALALTPLVIHSIGVAGYGVWILLTQLTGYAGLLDVGVQPAVARFVSEARARRDRDEGQSIISTAILLHGSIGLCVLALLALLSFFVDRWFDLGGLSRADVRVALVIVGVATAIGFPASVLTAVLKGRLRFDLVSVLTTGTQLVRAAAIVLGVWWWRGGILGLALASLAASIVGLGGAVWLVRGQEDGLSIRLRAVSRPALRRLASVGAYAFASHAGWYVAYATDAVLIAAILSARDVASFGLVTNVLSILSGVAGAFAQTFLPLASGYRATGMSDSLRRSYVVGSRLSLAIALPLALALLLEGPRLLVSWVGPEVGLPAGTLLRVLTLAHLPVIANGVAAQMAWGAGLQRSAALLSIGEGLSNLALSYVLARRLGVVGVAVGTLVASWVFQGLIWPFWMGRAFGSSLLRYWGEALGPALVPVLPALATFGLLSRIVRPDGMIGLALLVTLPAVVYVLVAVPMCVPSDDRALIWSWLRGRLR
jgi:O-antigen/teichoic acid export membrane protein